MSLLRKLGNWGIRIRGLGDLGIGDKTQSPDIPISKSRSPDTQISHLFRLLGNQVIRIWRLGDWDNGEKPKSPNPPISKSRYPDTQISHLLEYALIAAVIGVCLWQGIMLLEGASSNFTQANWTTQVSTSNALLPQANWVEYSAKDAGVVAAGNIMLQSTSYTATQTSNVIAQITADTGSGDTCSSASCSIGGGFNAGTKTSTTVSGSDATASVKLLYVCGVPFTVNHTTANGVAPVDKTVTYGTVSTTLGGTGSKCWITQNLGATTNAASATESTEPNAGWYWQFNRKQGYQHDGTTRTPASAWITSISESSDWSSANDPCTIELGAGWRLPTSAEWTSADSTGGWANYNDTYASVLKLHAAGYLGYLTGALNDRGSLGTCWSSTQLSSPNGYYLRFSSSASYVDGLNKAYGFSVRCLKD